MTESIRAADYSGDFSSLLAQISHLESEIRILIEALDNSGRNQRAMYADLNLQMEQIANPDEQSVIEGRADIGVPGLQITGFVDASYYYETRA